MQQITICTDPDEGKYSGALYLAFKGGPYSVPFGVHSKDESERQAFWEGFEADFWNPLGKGRTPRQSENDLVSQLEEIKAKRKELSEGKCERCGDLKTTADAVCLECQLDA